MGLIDISESIRTKRLKHNDSFWGRVGRWAERGFFYLIGLFSVIFPIKEIIVGLKTDSLIFTIIVISIISVAMGIWVIHGLLFMDKLTVVQGIEKSRNKDLVYDLLSEMFYDCKFYFIGEELSGGRDWRMRKPGKDFTILFDETDIYINITHKVRFGDMDSPFHVLKNQVDIREIKRRFRLKIENSSNV